MDSGCTRHVRRAVECDYVGSRGRGVCRDCHLGMPHHSSTAWTALLVTVWEEYPYQLCIDRSRCLPAVYSLFCFGFPHASSAVLYQIQTLDLDTPTTLHSPPPAPYICTVRTHVSSQQFLATAGVQVEFPHCSESRREEEEEYPTCGGPLPTRAN